MREGRPPVPASLRITHYASRPRITHHASRSHHSCRAEENRTASLEQVAVILSSGSTSMEGMRVCWPEKGQASVEAFSVPQPSAGEVLIQTEVSLISPGTERAFFLGLPN